MLHFKNINFTKDPLTTLLGLIIVVAAIVSVFLSPGITWEGASVGIVLGLGISGLKDDSLGLGNKNGGGTAVIVFFLSMTALVSCLPIASKSVTEEKTDSTWTVEKTVEKKVPVPADSTKTSADNPCPMASMDTAKLHLLQKGITSKGSKNARATLKIDKQDKIECDCNCDPYIAKIQDKNLTIYRLQKLIKVMDTTKVATKTKVPWYAKIAIWYTVISLVFIILFLIFLYFKKTINPFS